MTHKELNEVLELHKLWLEGKGGKPANLSYEDLSGMFLYNKNLRYINLSYTNLSYSNLKYTDLSFAKLNGANLSFAKLNGAKLNGTKLNLTELTGVDLSGTKGLINPIEYLNANFERTEEGYIVYKIFEYAYLVPNNWEIKPNSIIEEEVDYNRCNKCGCGINVATKQRLKTEIGLPVWKLLIKWEWLPSVVVPYNTDGKIRCGKAMLLKVVDE